MRCEIRLDPDCEQPYAVIHTAKLTPEIEFLCRQLENSRQSLAGYRDGQLYLLPQEQLLRVYTEKQKVFAQTADGVFLLKIRLYEVEDLLDMTVFLRISNAEIVNSRSIRKLDISLTGTIGVYLDNDIQTYASRRYVARIKNFFGLRKGEGK